MTDTTITPSRTAGKYPSPNTLRFLLQQPMTLDEGYKINQPILEQQKVMFSELKSDIKLVRLDCVETRTDVKDIVEKEVSVLFKVQLIVEKHESLELFNDLELLCIFRLMSYRPTGPGIFNIDNLTQNALKLWDWKEQIRIALTTYGNYASIIVLIYLTWKLIFTIINTIRTRKRGMTWATSIRLNTLLLSEFREQLIQDIPPRLHKHSIDENTTIIEGTSTDLVPSSLIALTSKRDFSLLLTYE